MTIEERARKFATVKPAQIVGNGLDEPADIDGEMEYGYIHGATDQRDIDIQRVIKWHCEHCVHKPKCHEDSDGYHRLDGFICIQIDSLKQAMKGE